MRKLVLAGTLLLFVLLAACKRAGSAKLEGHWKGMRAEGVDPMAQIQATSFAMQTEIIAQGSQIAIQTPAGRNPPANYFVDKEDPTTLVIHTDRDGNTETFTFNDKADVMVWHIDAQKTIMFRRVP